METALVIIIVVGALAYVGHSLWRAVTSKEATCSCTSASSCQSHNCHACQQPTNLQQYLKQLEQNN